MTAVLRESAVQATAGDPDADVIGLAKGLRQRGAVLCESAALLTDDKLRQVAEGWRKRGASLCKILGHVNTMINQSGLLDPRLLPWLDRMIESPNADALVELTELELMQNEFHWQLRNVRRVIDAVADLMRSADASACQLLETAAGNVERWLGAQEGGQP